MQDILFLLNIQEYSQRLENYFVNIYIVKYQINTENNCKFHDADSPRPQVSRRSGAVWWRRRMPEVVIHVQHIG